MFSNGKDKQTKKQTHKLLTTEPPRDHHGVGGGGGGGGGGWSSLVPRAFRGRWGVLLTVL